jgi:uncharacterized protein
MTIDPASGYWNTMLEKKKIVWVLQGARTGDNAQARELAAVLDASLILKELQFNGLHHLPNSVLGASVASLTAPSKTGLQPPWPDMVIAAGKRAAPVALWIKRKSKAQTKTVHLGRPRARLSAFDLVIATPQYGLPPDANVAEHILPFATPRKVDANELEKWRMSWEELPKPLIAVAIGNQKYPLRFGIAEAQLLGRQLNDLAKRTSGSVLLLASPRTDSSLVGHIASELQVPYKSYGEFDNANNPYQSALKLCDRFVATSDSISMISELMNTGKPVDVFELPVAKLRLRWSARQGFGAWLSRSGILQPPRDVAGMVRQLIESRAIGALGTESPRKIFHYDEGRTLDRLKNLLKN